MKILFVVPYVPSLVRVRPYNFIRFLFERGHQITLATLWTDNEESGDLERIKPFCQQVVAFRLSRIASYKNALLALPGKAPLQSVYSWDAGFARQLVNLIQKENAAEPFDVVHVEHLRGARYGLYIKKTLKDGSRSEDLPVIWDSVDNISKLFRQASAHSRKLSRRLLTQFEWQRTRRYEGYLVDQFDRTLVTSPWDREAFAELLTDGARISQIQVVPNGVDLDYFQPGNETMRDPASLVISGKMSYHANVSMCLDFVSQTMPKIWERRPDVKLCLVGKDPPAEIRELTRNPSITVTGTVEDIRPYLQKATIAVAPLTYGTGIQNKVLEAMACATPVVTTPQAVSALKTTPGADVMVGKDSDELSTIILNLLGDSDARLHLGEAGRRYVEMYHCWQDIVGQLEMIYQQAGKS